MGIAHSVSHRWSSVRMTTTFGGPACGAADTPADLDGAGPECPAGVGGPEHDAATRASETPIARAPGIRPFIDRLLGRELPTDTSPRTPSWPSSAWYSQPNRRREHEPATVSRFPGGLESAQA